jgi:hypothetical protein
VPNRSLERTGLNSGVLANVGAPAAQRWRSASRGGPGDRARGFRISNG